MVPLRRRPLPLLLVLALVGGTFAFAAAPEAVAAPKLEENAARGLRYGGLARAVAGPCKGTFEIPGHARRGGPARCTHGPDAAPDGVDVRVARQPVAPAEAALQPVAAGAGAGAGTVCTGDGSTGPRVQLIYAHVTGRTDRFATYAESFQTWAAAVDGVFDRSAAGTGGSRRVRFVHDSTCRPVVARTTVSLAAANDFGTTVSELVAKGFSRDDRKYLVWMDANVYCGIGEMYNDDRAGQNNYNNLYSLISRVDNGCWGLVGQSVEAHELMHNLGGVQTSAPNATVYGHCTDESDRMCYPDGSVQPMVQKCPAAHENTFDCNHDDYFSTAPPAGSYLATHWNTANSAWLAAPAVPLETGTGFNPLPPARILDTREGNGAPLGKVAAGGRVDLQVTGRGGVPASGVSAVSLNVTVTEPTAPGYLTAWPAGAPRPLASNLNFTAGQTVPNLVVVKVGAGGQVSLFNSSGTTHVVADVAGWYGLGGAPGGSRYHPVAPSRLLDTRTGLGLVGGLVSALLASAALELQVTGVGGIPSTGVSSVVLNMTATEPAQSGFLTAWPSGALLPLASNLNFGPAQTVANLTVLKVGTGGKVNVYNGSGGRVHVVADVAGWFGPEGDAAGARYHPLSPSRVLDTREGNGAPQAPLAGGYPMDLQVTGRGGVPISGVTAVILNVTAVAPARGGYLTVWPAGNPLPLASNLNFATGETRPNLVVAKVGAGGKVSIYNGGGTAHLVADVAGWYGTG